MYAEYFVVLVSRFIIIHSHQYLTKEEINKVLNNYSESDIDLSDSLFEEIGYSESKNKEKSAIHACYVTSGGNNFWGIVVQKC